VNTCMNSMQWNMAQNNDKNENKLFYPKKSAFTTQWQAKDDKIHLFLAPTQAS